MWQRFSPDARAIILRAQAIALEWNHPGVSPIHLFLALLESAHPDSYLGALLLGAGLKREEARLYVEATLDRGSDSSTDGEPRLTPDSKRVLELAAADARQAGTSNVHPEHLLFACLQPRIEPTLEAALLPLGWDLAMLRANHRELSASALPSDSPLEMLTGNAQKALESSYAAMRATWCGRISTTHLLMGILDDHRVWELLTELGVSSDELKARARAEIRSDSRLATADKRFDKGAKRALDRAKHEASKQRYNFIGPEHILLGLLPQRASLREKFRWGLQVPDAAAPLLAEIDAQKLRELLGTQPLKMQVLPKSSSPDVTRKAISGAFSLMFVCGFASISTLSRTSSLPNATKSAGVVTLLVLLVTTSLGACWMLLASKKPNTKSAWVAAFAGLLLGMMLTALTFAH